MPVNHLQNLPYQSDEAKTSSRLELPLTLLYLLTVAVTVFAPWIFSGKAFYWGDIGLFFIPLSHFLKESLASGTVPLWNPYLFCGAPFVGNPQVSVLYPSTLLLPLFPAAQAIMISEVAHIFAAGAFFWLFARFGSLKLSSYAAILSATIYMLCGYYVAKAQFPNMLAALTYVPLLFYQTELLVLKPTVRRTAIFGTALGMQLLAAHTQITVFTLYLLVPYAFLVYYSSPVRPPFGRVLQMGIVGGLFAVGLACCYWLPVAELIHSSARQVLTLKIANRFYLPWYELGNFVLPHLYGSPMRGDWRARGNYWETNNYVGLVPAFLFLYYIAAVFLKQSSVKVPRGQFLFWSIIFVVSIWLSVGSEGGLYPIAFVILPALKAFHDPARLMLGANVAIALFAGAGLQSIQDKVGGNVKVVTAVILLLLTGLDLGWQDRGIYPLKSISEIGDMQQADVPRRISESQIKLGAGRILMPDSRRAWQSFTTYKHYSSSDPRYMPEWPNTLAPCLAMADNIREVGGYDPEYRRDSQYLVDLADAPLNTRRGDVDVAIGRLPANYANYLSTLGVQFLVTYRVDSIAAASLKRVYRSPWQRQGRRVEIFQNETYKGRAALYGNWLPVKSQNDSFNLVAERLNLLPQDKRAFEVPVAQKITDIVTAPDVPAMPCVFLKDLPDDVVLETPPVSHSSLVVLADTMHPGWTAAVDGQTSKIFRANVDQRAVYIAASNIPTAHNVEFRYVPVDIRVGFYVSLVTLLTILAILFGSADKSKLNI